MFRGICIALALSIFSVGWCTEDGGGQVRMSLEARDLVVGEISIMGDRALTLRVENQGANAVRLPTGGSSRWMVDSRLWTVHIEGPVDSRCEERQVVVTRTLPVGGRYEETIGAGEEKSFDLPGLGIGQEGEYRIWVEYRGDLAREDELRDVLRTDEVVLRILAPGPAEEEAIRWWREQNPDTPWCMFPGGMVEDLLKPDAFIEKYPTSLYAGWQLWRRLRSHAGGFPGQPSAADPSLFFQVVRESPTRVLYEERKHSNGSPKGTLLRTEEAAKWRIKAIETFLSAHGDFLKASEMRLRMAMDYIGLGKHEHAKRELDRIIGSWPQSKAANRAADYLLLLQRHTEWHEVQQ